MSNFGNLEILLILLRKFAELLLCQLLKGQQNLVCFNRRKGNIIAELRLTGRAFLFLLSWRCTRGAVSEFFVNSCHHVVAIFWARVLCHLAVEDACVRMRVSLGVILIRSLACTKYDPGRLRSGSRAVPEWPWISGFMRNTSRRANAPIMRFSILLNSYDNFLVTLPSISSQIWVM